MYSVDCMRLQSCICVCVCVGRVLPVTHESSLALRNVAPQSKSGKPPGGAGASGAAWDCEAGQDGNVGGQDSGV